LGLAHSAKITHPSRNCTKNGAVRRDKTIAYHEKKNKLRLLPINIFHIGTTRNASKTEQKKKLNKFKFFFLVDMRKLCMLMDSSKLTKS
jgi:hypothetical protein